MLKITEDPNIQKTIAGAMFGTSAAAYLHWIPGIVAVFGVLLGFLVSYSIIMKNLADRKKSNIEIKILQDREKARLAAAIKRQKSNEPCRRLEDYQEGKNK